MRVDADVMVERSVNLTHGTLTISFRGNFLYLNPDDRKLLDALDDRKLLDALLVMLETRAAQEEA